MGAEIDMVEEVIVDTEEVVVDMAEEEEGEDMAEVEVDVVVGDMVEAVETVDTAVVVVADIKPFITLLKCSQFKLLSLSTNVCIYENLLRSAFILIFDLFTV